MTESQVITGADLCRGFREKALRAEAGEDEKVVRILGCPTIVKKGWASLSVLRARKALAEAFRHG